LDAALKGIGKISVALLLRLFVMDVLRYFPENLNQRLEHFKGLINFAVAVFFRLG
jgi:uncharacterized membrane-anchored protein